MDRAIRLLEEELSSLKAEANSNETTSEKAARIGAINKIDSAISLLNICSKHGINAGSIVKALPDHGDVNFQFIVAHMNESTNPENWEEVLFDGEQFWLDGGDLVIKR